jgi:hypothetical protein
MGEVEKSCDCVSSVALLGQHVCVDGRGGRPMYYIFIILYLDRCKFIFHSAVCLTTGPKPLPKRAVHIVRSTASSFK